MIVRVVRMTFKEEEKDNFLKIFNDSKNKIRNFEGCSHLELWNDITDKNTFTTYSHWESEERLNNYRNSDLFAGVWKATKALFEDKPVAQSYTVHK